MVSRESICHGREGIVEWQELMLTASHILEDQEAEKTRTTTSAEHDGFIYLLVQSLNKHAQDVKG